MEHFRKSLQYKFESELSDGGVPLVFRLPNGVKLTHKFDVSTKVCTQISFHLNGYVPEFHPGTISYTCTGAV